MENLDTSKLLEHTQTSGKNDRSVVIDEEQSDQDDNRIEDLLLPTNEVPPLPVNNACSQCQAFRENADRAWDVIQKLAKENEQQRILQNENYQLNNICKENRNYIATLRSVEETLKEVLKQKEKEIIDRDEKIDNLQKQYKEVLKAGSEIKKYIEERNFWQKKYENLDEERLKLQHKLNRSIEQIKDLKLKKSQELTSLHNEKSFELEQTTQLESGTSKNCAAQLEIGLLHEKSLDNEKSFEPEQTTQLEFYAFENYAAPLKIFESFDDDDLELALPPSPPLVTHEELNPCKPFNEKMEQKDLTTKGNQNLIVLSPIESIFDSSFFMEMQQMPLITDDITVQIFEQPESQCQTKPVIKIDLPLGNEASSLVIHQIAKKHNIDKQQASLLYSRAKRESAKERLQRKRKIESSDDDEDKASVSTHEISTRTRNPQKLMPWRPVREVLPKNTKKSVLSREDHKRYVSIIRNQLQAMPTYRFEQNKNEIHAMDKLLEEERQFYANVAMKKACDLSPHPYNYPSGECLHFYRNIGLAKINRYIGKRTFDKIIIDNIPWNKEITTTENTMWPVNFRIVDILKPGLPIHVTIPDIQRKFTLSYTKINQMTNVFNANFEQKTLIDEDPKIHEYALANNVPVLMDASTLRHFICSTWSQRPQNYACRISIIRKVHEGSIRNLVIILPPTIASRAHKTSVSNAFIKWALKCTLLYNDEGKSKKAMSTKKCKEETPSQSLLDDLGIGHLNMQKEYKKRCAIVSFDDPKQEIDDDSQHRVVIRTGLHGIEKATSIPISMTARAEFLAEVGAEKLTFEEHLWNITTGILKGSKENLNFRIIPRSGSDTVVVQYDRKTPDLSTLDNEIRCLLSMRIQRFCNLMDVLKKLPVGEYLAVPDLNTLTMRILEERHSGSPTSSAAISEEVYDSNWFQRIIRSRIYTPANFFDEYWNGIDPHYPLQWHVVKSQIPGALYPK